MKKSAKGMRNTFLFKQRFFQNKVTLRFLLISVPFDVFLLGGGLWLAGSSVEDLRSFLANAPVVRTGNYTVGMFGIFGWAFIRLSMIIAYFRNNMAPQPVEWFAALFGIAWIAAFLTFNSIALSAWAGAHGYTRCEALKIRERSAVFVRDAKDCSTASGPF